MAILEPRALSDTTSADTAAQDQRSSPLRPVPPGRDAGLERVLDRVRPWALRQAERSYGHLPERDRVAAVDAALRDLRARGVAADLRAARVGVADDLTARLRSAHVAWCNRPSAVDAPPPTTPRAPDTVADVIERGLKGLERAVLQLEIGAGRDTRTARAALRLGPRDYSRHRREGLAKLRAAIGGQTAGHVCDAHAGDVVLAATGDDAALARLGAGPGRCRSCSREAQGLRRLLHQRLGLAPWPLTIKPMGVVAAKLAGLGAAAGTATVAGGGSGAFGGGVAGIAATVAGVAALAGGTFAIVDRAPAEQPVEASGSAVTAAPAATRAVTPAPTRRRAASTSGATGTRAAAGADRRRTPSKPRPAPVAPAPATTAGPAEPTAPETSAPTSAPAPTATPVQDTVTNVTDTVRGVGGTVQDATAPLTGALPPALAAPVEETVDGAAGTLDGVAGAVDQTTGALGQTVGGLTTP